MICGSEGAMAIAPMEAIGSASKMGRQVRPAFAVFQTPPPTAPKRYSLGLPGTPSAGRTRPPRWGPIMRHCISGKRGCESSCCENACCGQKIAATEANATKNDARNLWEVFIVCFFRVAEYTPLGLASEWDVGWLDRFAAMWQHGDSRRGFLN